MPPNRLGYCGPRQSWEKFQEFLSKPGDALARQTELLLRRFNALFPYLQLIAEANNLQPFDEAVVEAYWLGNGLLEKVPLSKTRETILSLQRFGLPKRIAEEKAASLSLGMVPHHSLHVLHVNFITERVKPLLPNLSNCLVQWGKARGESSKGVKVKGVELLQEGGQVKMREKRKTVENPFSIEPGKGEMVSVHWGNAVERISQKEAGNLKNYTEAALSAFQA